MGNCCDSQVNQQILQQEDKHNNMSEEDKVMIQLKHLRDQLLQKKRKTEEEVNKCDQQIRQLLKMNKKELAKQTVQRKKLYEEYEKSLENKYQVVQQAILEVERQVLDKGVGQVIKDCNRLLKQVQETNQIVEHLQQYQDNIKTLENQQSQIDQLCQQMQVDNQDVEQEYLQYEREINNISNNRYQPQQQHQQQQQQYLPQQQQQQQQQQQPQVQRVIQYS